MIKRIIAAALAFCVLFCLNVSATSVPYKAGEELFVYGENNAKIAEILNLNQEELDLYCKENNINYLAVNADNSKQIKVSSSETEFSNSVVNISFLSDEKISTLIPEIIGIDGARGEIVKKGAQKLIKTELKSEDSGGEYLLTQYITVANKITYILSFYTEASADSGYISEFLEKYQNSDFLVEESQDKEENNYGYIMLAAAVIFAAAAVIITVTVIKDIKKDKALETFEEDSETDLPDGEED